MGSVPVGNVVDVALRSSIRHQISIPNRHVNHSVFEIQVLLEFHVLRENVSHLNSVLIVQVGLPVVVSYLLVHHFSKYDVTVSTSTST